MSGIWLAVRNSRPGAAAHLGGGGPGQLAHEPAVSHAQTGRDRLLAEPGSAATSGRRHVNEVSALSIAVHGDGIPGRSGLGGEANAPLIER